MKDIIIVGAGGFGREAYYVIKSINRIRPTWRIKGFIDDTEVNPRDFRIDLPVLGSIKEWCPSEGEHFALGISSPEGKEKVVRTLESRGAVFVTLIDPAALVNEAAVIGRGSIISACSSIGDCSVIGNFVHIAGSMIGQDVVIGDFSTTTGHTNVPNTKIGKKVFLGSHSVILAEVEDEAFVGAGSVVVNRVKSRSRVFGNPAKIIDF